MFRPAVSSLYRLLVTPHSVVPVLRTLNETVDGGNANMRKLAVALNADRSRIRT